MRELIISYCLNCIRHDGNSTYKTGLTNTYQTLSLDGHNPSFSLFFQSWGKLAYLPPPPSPSLPMTGISEQCSGRTPVAMMKGTCTNHCLTQHRFPLITPSLKSLIIWHMLTCLVQPCSTPFRLAKISARRVDKKTKL